MAQKERRRSRRFDRALPIWVLQDQQEIARGRTSNVSRSGAYFRSSLPPSVKEGTTVSVRIGLPQSDGFDRTVSGEARVVRMDETEGDCGIALHFSEELDPLDRTE